MTDEQFARLMAKLDRVADAFEAVAASNAALLQAVTMLDEEPAPQQLSGVAIPRTLEG